MIYPKLHCPKRKVKLLILKPTSSAEWLKMRREIGIGGSDAGAVVGLNHWKTNVDLWKEKTGISKGNNISDNQAVKFGKEAEKYIRGLFVLEHPEYLVDYHEFWMYLNSENDFMYATLDGELKDRNTGEKGILEIKTTTIHNSNQWNDWENRIPDSYYVQVLHQLACTGWNFAILKAYIMYTAKNGGNNVTIREYRIDRKDVVLEIEYLLQKEREFIQYVRDKKEPPLILPRI